MGQSPLEDGGKGSFPHNPTQQNEGIGANLNRRETLSGVFLKCQHLLGTSIPLVG